jgi:hypothetical protein
MNRAHKTVLMNVHQDQTDSGRTVWWADTDDVVNLTVGGDSLAELEVLAREAVDFHLGAGIEVRFVAEDTQAAVST